MSDKPKIGEQWQGQGGIRAGAEIPTADGRSYDLVVVTDAAGKPVLLDAAEWGLYGTEVEGADNFTDGTANHTALLAAGHELSKAAAAIATVDGQTDCTLPSIGESNIVRALLPDLVQVEDDEDLWSNTQYSGNLAWIQYFSSGFTDYWDKHDSHRALVVRRVWR
ncbi:MAG TPA: hypothetical protein VGH91_04695 [Gammaproteobacteria bacterium]|jgi:hypothetical protein